MNLQNLRTSFSNVPNQIGNKIGRNLHKQKDHPIELVCRKIIDYFINLDTYKFKVFDDLDPFVKIEDNFDKLLLSKDHPARSKSDTYYVSEEIVLRTHTSAHQNQLLAKGEESFLVIGDVYRKDEIDKSHYPVFHQMEILTLVDDDKDPVSELKKMLTGLVNTLFYNCEFRINDDYFPFTDPSFEVEVMYMGNWLEILGCGVVHEQIMKNNGLNNRRAFAIGLGMERLAMIFFEIPDIRYMWSTHERFIDQFANCDLNDQYNKFKPYSELPSITKDISFYLPDNSLDADKKWILENDFFEYIRGVSGELLENVALMSTFYNDKVKKDSRAYRMTYSPNDPKYTNPSTFTEDINNIQTELRNDIEKVLNIELR
jgi:phenylalanyl-tRNA synthetase alpha chain